MFNAAAFAFICCDECMSSTYIHYKPSLSSRLCLGSDRKAAQTFKKSSTHWKAQRTEKLNVLEQKSACLYFVRHHCTLVDNQWTKTMIITNWTVCQMAGEVLKLVLFVWNNLLRAFNISCNVLYCNIAYLHETLLNYGWQENHVNFTFQAFSRQKIPSS